MPFSDTAIFGGAVPAQAGYDLTLPAPQARTARGEVVWGWIALAFAGYWAMFVTGAYTKQPQLNNVGAVIILATLGWASVERLWAKVDSVSIACLVAAIMPVFVVFVSHATPNPDAMIKHISLYVVIALARMLRLPAACSSRMRGVLAGQVLIILVLSATTDRGGGVWDGGTRHSGLFANPNNLALIPFLLLFFIDRRRDRVAVQLGAHAVVIGVLALTGTSGAVIAYVIGLAVHFGHLLRHPWRAVAITLATIGGLAGIGLLAFGGETMLPETRLTNQITVMRAELGTVLDGGQVAYYEKEKVLGSGSASAIWRLAHWRKTIVKYADGSLAQQIVGFGIGSSPGFLGKMPHNEYLRVLFEQGLVGLTLFLFAWTKLIRTAPKDIRYCGLILAIYSFSENNLDNFPFMSLFILCLAANGPVSQNRAVRVR